MAKVAVRCTHCDKRYSLAEAGLGKSMKCPACQQTFVAAAEEAEAEVAEQEQVAQPSAPPQRAASGGGGLFDDEDLFSEAAAAPAHPSPSAGQAGSGKKKGKRASRGSAAAEIRIYRQDGQWKAEIPLAVILKHPGVYLCGAGILYSLLSLVQLGFLDPWGLVGAGVSGGLGYGSLTKSYYLKWTDFCERELSAAEAPEPLFILVCFWGVIVSVAVAGTMYLANSNFKPAHWGGPHEPAPNRASAADDGEATRQRRLL